MATYCVGPAATGTGAGNDWNNLKAWTDTPVRGDTWYLIDGTYAAKTFSTAVSGATLITIKKAIPLDHGGIETGWDTSLGNGIALFSGQIKFTTSYWVFDGQSGGGPATSFNGWTSGYGFKIQESTSIPVLWFNGCGDINLAHVEIVGLLSATGGLGNQGIRCASDALTPTGSGQINVNRCYIHNTGHAAVWHQDGPLSLDYCFIGSYRDTVGEPCAMAEIRSAELFRFRWGVAAHVEGIGGFVAMNDDPADGLTTAEIYGSVFYEPPAPDWIAGGQGLFGALAADTGMLDWKVYNNTFVNITNGDVYGDSGDNPAGCEATNNYFYGTPSHTVDTGWTESYNHFQDSGTATGTNSTTGTGDPFADYVNYDFRLELADTTAGLVLAAPYDVDMAGEVRGEDGSWTRGAFEFVEDEDPPPPPEEDIEQFGTTSTGVSLWWFPAAPAGTGPWPTVCLFHPGGFHAGRFVGPGIRNSLRAAGFMVFDCECRLAPPHSLMNESGGHPPVGQDVAGDDGRWNKQTQDVSLAIRMARADSRCDGRVYAVGGSAGGSHAAYLAFTGTVADDRPDLVVGISGVYSFDNIPRLLTDYPPGETNFHEAIWNYVNQDNSPDPFPDYEQAFIDDLHEAQPLTYLTDAAPPFFAIVTTNDSGGVDTADFPDLIAGFEALGINESVSAVPVRGTYKKAIVQVTENIHAFNCWQLPIDGVPGHQTVEQAVIAWLNGGIPVPGEGDDTVLKGASIGTSAGAQINQAVLDNPYVDGIGLNVHWSELELSEGNFDWTYLDSQIRRAAAAGKKIIIRPTTMGGSAFFEGNTPNWVFSAMGALGTPGDRTFRDDCSTTSGDPTVTSPTADFTSHDVGSNVTGDGMPGAPTYIGLVNSPTSIELSSDPDTHVPVNATATFTGDASLLFGGRERVNAQTHDVVWGQTYDYFDPNPNHEIPQSTIPVFWNPIFNAKKKAMLNALGDHITRGLTLTPAEKAAVSIISIAYCNAQTEDWNMPSDDTIDGENTLTRYQRWVNSPTDPDPDLRGAGYDTQLMIDTAICRRPTEDYTDGETFTSTRLVSATANFMFADIGCEVSNPGGVFPPNTRIAAWISLTEVQLDKAASITTTGLLIRIHNRKTGIYDITLAAFPGKFITSAIAGNDRRLDEEASDEAGYDQPETYLEHAVITLANDFYPGRCIHQKNGLNARIPNPPGQGPFRVLSRLNDAGNYVAFQDTYAVFGDPLYRMNGGDPDDYETISNNCTLKAALYGALYREMYPADVAGIPGAIKFCHDTLNPDEEPPEPPQPPPSVVPRAVLEPFLTLDESNFRDDIIFQIADLLNVSIIDGLASITRARLETWGRIVNRHLDYAWRLIKWPEFSLLEERPFELIWNPNFSYKQGSRVYYIGTEDEDFQLEDDGGYYIARIDVDPGSAPPISNFWTPLELAAQDYFIPLLQRCRRRIGDVMAVYSTDPRPAGYAGPSLPWVVTNRGLEVSAGDTVFIAYQAVPYRYTGFILDSGSGIVKAGSVVLDAITGNCFRAVVDTNGSVSFNQPQWSRVPFPRSLANYVIYATAADDADETDIANQYRALALEYLGRVIDAKEDEMHQSHYNFSRGMVGGIIPGTSSFWWSAFPPFRAPAETDGTQTTIAQRCLTEWGDIIPT